MLALAAAVVLSQTIYTWVDRKGVTHFTDDATELPAHAKTTKGAAISVVKYVPLPKRPVPVRVEPRVEQPVGVTAPSPVPVPVVEPLEWRHDDLRPDWRFAPWPLLALPPPTVAVAAPVVTEPAAPAPAPKPAAPVKHAAPGRAF